MDGVDLSIKAGDFVAIMGRTGCGKTTLCLALNGIVPHSTGGTIGGTVTIGGKNSRHQSVAELAQTVGLVFQEPETQLFNMTVEAEVAFGLETLGMPPAEIDARIDWALHLVGMSRFRSRSPFELSGGQKQRVAIAAILAMKPPVLVLDEPTANLDPLGKREVYAVVDRLRRQEKMTIVMVSHESEQIAAFADRVVVLDGGKVAQDASPAEVFGADGVARAVGLDVPQLAEVVRRFGRIPTQLSAAKTRPISAEVPINDPIFTLTNVSFAYEQNVAAVRHVSLAIPRGTMVAILGQNGAGKTTLAKLLNGLLRPTAGQVAFNGSPIGYRTVAQMARHIGYVFQNPDHMIFSPTVREELAVGPRHLGLDEAEVAQRVEEALCNFNLDTFADVQPTTLSFGLRRKVSIASVLAMQTEVLILDEPTSGLDWQSSADVMAMLNERRARGNTILVITHDMQLVAAHFPRCLIMHEGQIMADDTTRSVFGQTALLQQAHLEAPPVTQLGRQLGIERPILSVDELSDYVGHR